MKLQACLPVPLGSALLGTIPLASFDTACCGMLNE